MYNKIISLVFFLIAIFLFIIPESKASSWTRKKNELYIVMEFLSESDKNGRILYEDQNSDYFKTNSYKLYLEYGLFNNITFGGYLKNYNFYSQYFDEYDRKITTKIKNDLYANLFIIQNIYNKNKSLFSLEYSYNFPIKYDKKSKDINNIDTKNSYGFRLLYGTDKNINLFENIVNYYIDLGTGYRIVEKSNYDEIKSNFVIGFRTNPSSTIILEYENKFYINSFILPSNTKVYDDYYKDNYSNKIQFSLDYKFLDSLSTKIAFYRNFSNTNSNGIIFSFIFN